MTLLTRLGLVLGLGVAAVSLRAADSPIVTSEFINEGAPYPECHASTIVEASPGHFAAAWFGGTKERNPDVCIWFARLIDGHWEKAANVGDGIQKDGPRLPTWNPVLFQAKDGVLALFYKIGPSPAKWWGMMRQSTDGGATWSAPKRLPDPILGPVKNKPVTLSDGSWYCPTSEEGTPTGHRVYFDVTKDDGATWTRIGPVDKGPLDLNAIQPSVLVLADGRLEALCRTSNGVLAKTLSSDGGKSWSALEKTGLPNPNSGTDAVTLKDHRQLLVYNPSAPPLDNPTKGKRYPLAVAVSKDGAAWTDVITLEDKPVGNGYAYPAVIQGSDGLVHITYTWDRKHIKYVVLDPSKF